MTQINLSVADDVKTNAEKVCQDLGVSLNKVITIFLENIGVSKEIPFEIPDENDPFYSKENMKELKRRIADMNAGKNMHEHELIEVE